MKKSAPKALKSTPQYLMKLDEAPKALAQQVLDDPKSVALVPTDQLVPLFVQGHEIAAKVGKVLDAVKEELKTVRREEGTPYGDSNQHRKITLGGASVCIEERPRWPLNHDKAAVYLKGKGLMQDACNLEISAGVEAMQKFLWKNRAFLRAEGIEVREVIDEKKMEHLLGLKKIPLKDFETLLDKNPPTYAIKVGK